MVPATAQVIPPAWLHVPVYTTVLASGTLGIVSLKATVTVAVAAPVPATVMLATWRPAIRAASGRPKSSCVRLAARRAKVPSLQAMPNAVIAGVAKLGPSATRARCVVLIRWYTHRSQDTNDRDNDHEFNECETVLCVPSMFSKMALHWKLPFQMTIGL
jgi:hypothetical protein